MQNTDCPIHLTIDMFGDLLAANDDPTFIALTNSGDAAALDAWLDACTAAWIAQAEAMGFTAEADTDHEVDTAGMTAAELAHLDAAHAAHAAVWATVELPELASVAK